MVLLSTSRSTEPRPSPPTVFSRGLRVLSIPEHTGLKYLHARVFVVTTCLRSDAVPHYRARARKCQQSKADTSLPTDPFAEADEETGETKQSQNYIHIRIQRMSLPFPGPLLVIWKSSGIGKQG